ncbi:MAG: hypothetical protein R3F39_24135, partial [Myxococcota bacterium]
MAAPAAVAGRPVSSVGASPRLVAAAWCALVLASASATWAAPVLQPGQDATLRDALATGGDSLGAGWRIEGFSVEGDRVELRLVGADARAATATIRGASGAAGAVETPLGWAEVPAELPAEAAEALLARLRAAPRPLRWRDDGGPGAPAEASAPALDPARAAAAQAEVSARLAGRLGLGPAAPPPALDPAVNAALDALTRGDAPAARTQLEALVRAALDSPTGELSPGALSVWLAAGGQPGLPPHALAERFPDEPRVAALMSAALRDDAAYDAAAAWVAHGLAAPLDDALLVREARALGLTVADPPAHALPAPPLPPGPPAWPWQLAGLALALALAATALVHRSVEAGLALLAAILAALAAIPPPSARSFPQLPPTLLAPVAAGPCHSGPARREGATLRVHATCPAGPLELVVRPTALAAPAEAANQRATAAH